MRNTIRSLAAAAVIGTAAGGASAQQGQAVQWRVEDGGNGHWYRFFPSVAKWADAQSAAQSRGGHLVTFSSATEQSAAFSLAGFMQNQSVWIGLRQDLQASDYSEPAGGWRWITGEALEFAGWSAGNPNNAYGMEHVGEWSPAWGGGWNDMPNLPELVRPALVEWSADCNGDGIVDYGQCHDGSLPDYNLNNIPDCCEIAVPCEVGRYPVQWRVEDGGNGHWYFRSLTQIAVSRDALLAAGRAVSAYAVTLSSQDEERFVYSQFGFCVLGLVAMPGAPSFTWLGEPANTYSNWGVASCPSGPYPNDPIGFERVASLQSPNCPGTQGVPSKWDDYSVHTWPPQYPVLEWSADCNGDGVVDYGQILAGQLADTNEDGTPDICQCSGDITRNGVVDGVDLAAVLGAWGTSGQNQYNCDIDSDGVVGGTDLAYVLSGWGPCQ